MNMDNIIKEAVRQSQKTSYVFRLGAVIFDRHRIISGGYNRVFSYGSNDNQGNCAETLAIRKAPSKLMRGATLLVCRVNSSGSFGMSKPCIRCRKLIVKSGISKVIYSTPDGWETWNTDDELI
jgi:deoxycytidylate deaminase